VSSICDVFSDEANQVFLHQPAKNKLFLQPHKGGAGGEGATNTKDEAWRGMA